MNCNLLKSFAHRYGLEPVEDLCPSIWNITCWRTLPTIQKGIRAQIKNLSYFFVLFSVFFSPLSLHFLNADLTSWATDFESEFSSLCNNERQRYVTRSMSDSDTWLGRWPTAIRDSIDDRQRYVTRSMTDSDTWLDRWPTAIRDSVYDRQRYVTRSMTDSDTWLGRWPTAIRESIDDRQRYVTRSMTDSDTWLGLWPTAIRDSDYDRQRYVTQSMTDSDTWLGLWPTAIRDSVVLELLDCRWQRGRSTRRESCNTCIITWRNATSISFCRDKNMLFATKLLSRQNHVCRDKHTFVTSRQTRGRNDSCGSYRQWYTGPLLLLLLFLLRLMYYWLLACWKCSSAVHLFFPTVCAHRP